MINIQENKYAVLIVGCGMMVQKSTHLLNAALCFHIYCAAHNVKLHIIAPKNVKLVTGKSTRTFVKRKN